MRLEATCGTCGRQFLLMQILPEPEGTSGRCPFCGARFGRHYLAILPDAIRTAEAAADAFVASVNRLNDMHPGFQIDVRALLSRLRGELSETKEEAS